MKIQASIGSDFVDCDISTEKIYKLRYDKPRSIVYTNAFNVNQDDVLLGYDIKNVYDSKCNTLPLECFAVKKNNEYVLAFKEYFSVLEFAYTDITDIKI